MYLILTPLELTQIDGEVTFQPMELNVIQLLEFQIEEN